MKAFNVSKADEGQTLVKYVAKLMKLAPMSVIRKAIRKKNIDLNKKRATGNEMLKAGDVVQIWFSDETFQKFETPAEKYKDSKRTESVSKSSLNAFKKNIIFEDDNVLLVNKPAGILTQADETGKASLNDELLAYFAENENLKLRTVKPSVCNRLDRNTSGIVICGKTIKGLQQMNDIIKDRSVHKYYRCLCSGTLKGEGELKGWLLKDKKKNEVVIKEKETDGALPVITKYRVLDTFIVEGCEITYVEVLLVTGRSHQIRAHFASIGHPLLGDLKYGNAESLNITNKLKIKRQLLHAYCLEFPKLKGDFQSISEKKVTADIPADINSLLKFRR